MLVSGLHHGVCKDDVKNAKKAVILEYLYKHVRVNIIVF